MPWNKGEKLGFIPKGAFKKGHTPWHKNKKTGLVPKTAFKKGHSYGKRFKKGDMGEKCSAWKGGITPLCRMIRSLEENKQWIKSVFIKDNYICQECSIRSGNGKAIILNAHHKKTFATIFKEFLKEYNQFSPIEDKETLVRLAMNYQPFWDIDNGQTLCKDCHNLTKGLI